MKQFLTHFLKSVHDILCFSASHYFHLQVDEALKDLWFEYVPKKMKEHEFWRRYFIAVKRVRQEVIDSDCETSIGRSWASSERRLTIGGILNEVCLAQLFDSLNPSSRDRQKPRSVFSSCVYFSFV